MSPEITRAMFSPDKTFIQTELPVAVDMGLAFDSRTSKLSSQAVALRGLPNLGLSLDVASLLVALANPLHLPFRHIEDVCNFSTRIGFESLDDQQFGFWFDLMHVDRSNVEH